MLKNITKIPYNKELLSLLNNLSSINESFTIKKDDKKLKVQRSNNARSIAYRLLMDSSAFEFIGEDVSFSKFPEFFQLLSSFEEPDLYQIDNKLVISKDKCKINYILTDAETLTKSPSNIKFENPQVEFQINSEDLKELKKMIGLLTALKTKFSCSKNKIEITCYNSNHDNSFSKSYATTKCTKEMEFPISSDIFTLIPDGNYTVELLHTKTKQNRDIGVVRLSLQRKDVSLEISTAELDEE